MKHAQLVSRWAPGVPSGVGAAFVCALYHHSLYYVTPFYGRQLIMSTKNFVLHFCVESTVSCDKMYNLRGKYDSNKHVGMNGHTPSKGVALVTV